ncbi:MAG TPA: DUF192 domain-containing protein [Candidatus Rubrimentiphilum sp.]|nr:DUF192 domain-containing protein [Candidatus Rubrimentiphilum sp.]
MLSAFMLLTLIAATPQPVPTPQALTAITLQAPHVRLRVQVARTEGERERGLMGVRVLRAHTGMLFVFDNDAPVEFWMKDTLVPLDMVFIGNDGIVRNVAADVPVVALDTPDSRIPRRDGIGRYVLELPAREARQDGLAPGARLYGLPP